MKLQKYISKVLDVLTALVLLVFFASFGFQDSRTTGWYQQFLPNLNGKSISDITFLDTLSGWAVATQSTDSSYILKTTNGGDNWQIIYRQLYALTKIKFLNLNTGFACGGYLYKTTNSGLNWNQINTPAISAIDMYVLNQDTIWIIDDNSLVGGVFLTTNGGLNWTQKFSAGTENPNKIYMFNSRIGFITNNNSGLINLRRTTNGGTNWLINVPNEGFYDMYFIDSLTGWRSYGNNMYKTTNGGDNWITQFLPTGGNIINTGINEFSNINSDTIWGVGGIYWYGASAGLRGMIYRTTNGGNNWYYQIPDTSIHIPQYSYIKFVNKKSGWAYSKVYGGVHTITGGDSLFVSKVHQTNSEIPKNHKLSQNYPNPFNQLSIISYEISKSLLVKLEIYDIIGKKIITLVNQKQIPGEYKVIFDGANLSSGIYFYSLNVNGKSVDTKKAVILK